MRPRHEQMQIEFDTGYKAGYVAGRIDGLRMGRADGREQAAKACEDVLEPDGSSPDFGLAVDMCVDAIRNLQGQE